METTDVKAVIIEPKDEHEERIERIDQFFDEHPIMVVSIMGGILVGLGYLIGRVDKRKLSAKKMIEFANLYNAQIDEECDLAVINFAKRVMPKEKTLYVVERSHDACGRTHGELAEFIRNNYKLIESKEK